MSRKGQYAPGDTTLGRLKGKDYMFLLEAGDRAYDPLDTEFRALVTTAEQLVTGVDMRGRRTRTGFGPLSAYETLHKLSVWVNSLDARKQRALKLGEE